MLFTLIVPGGGIASRLKISPEMPPSRNRYAYSMDGPPMVSPMVDILKTVRYIAEVLSYQYFES